MGSFVRALALTVCAVAAWSTVGSAHADTGCGAGGYCYVDCREAGGPACDYTNAAVSDGATGACSDDLTSPSGSEMPWGFPFYGTLYTDVTISANGVLYLGGGVPDAINAPLTGLEGRPAIAVLWDDWAMDNDDALGFICLRPPACSNSGPFTFVESFQTGAGSDAIGSYFEVEWFSTEHHVLCNGDTVTFGVRLYSTGQILMQYQDVTLGNAGYDGGASATIGVTRGTAGEFTQFSFNTPSIPSEPFAILWNPFCTDGDGDGDCSIATGGTDCDDGDPMVHPGAADSCNGLDDDCDSSTADGSSETWYDTPCDGADSDFCVEGVYECTAGTQTCSDATGGTVEMCGGGDEDCDGLVDGADPDIEDIDSDGADACIDCDDDDAANFPGNTEVCDGQDNDCNGFDDFGAPGIAGAETDDDGDGVSECGGDCNDTPGSGSTIFPGADDSTCDGIDDDCDGASDEAYATSATTCGVGACASAGTLSCVDGSLSDDCAPATPAASDSTCDGIDDDCDGRTDEDSACGMDAGMPDAGSPGPDAGIGGDAGTDAGRRDAGTDAGRRDATVGDAAAGDAAMSVDPEPDSGCSCRTTEPSDLVLSPWWLLLLAWIRRRRRASPRP